jgi:hypothetical protein
LIDEGYLSDESKRKNIKYNSDIYRTKQQWLDLFKEMGLELIETASAGSADNLDSGQDTAAIEQLELMS